MPIIFAEPLEKFATALLIAGGMQDDEARQVARSLVGANLRGHDSHGVMRIPGYLEQIKKGEVISGAALTICKETASTVVADGNWGLGQRQAARLMERLIEKATTAGVGIGTLIHSSHIGRLGEYCEQAADHGLVSMLMVNTHGYARRVAPPGGKAPRLGTNPIAFGVPHGKETMVLDFGTSVVAEGKVRVKKLAGENVPEGWLLDCEGQPTHDPATLYGQPPGTILPMGGSQGYKGFGLALMIEVFAGALSGGVCIRETPVNPSGNCVFMMAIDPDHLGGGEHFAREVTALAEFVRDCPRIPGVDEILLPGDPERRTLAERQQQGIPFDDGNWGQLTTLGESLGIVRSG